jgi:hypothetical protein
MNPTWAGVGVSALAVAAGAPWFDDGLRAIRLRRALTGLRPGPLDEGRTGLVQVQGRVTLDSPLFGPLSGRPCAGFALDVAAADGRAARIEEHRPFRLVADGVSARILAGDARWDLSIQTRRELAPAEPLTQRLESLFARSPEARWLRSCGSRLTLAERALAAGEVAHVVGDARHARPYEQPAELELGATGTDDASRLGAAASASRAPGPRGVVGNDPDLWIDGGPLELLLVSDRPLETRRYLPSPARTLGAALGPALSLTGLLYLAHVADAWRAAGRL